MTHPNRQLVVAALKTVVAQPIPKGSFQKKYLKVHLEDGIEYYNFQGEQGYFDYIEIKDKDDLKFKGYVEVVDYDNWGLGGIADDYDHRRGWGKDMDRDIFIETISTLRNNKQYYEDLFDRYEKNRLAPATAINYEIVDGTGRSLWAWALDVPLLVASFVSKNP